MYMYVSIPKMCVTSFPPSFPLSLSFLLSVSLSYSYVFDLNFIFLFKLFLFITVFHTKTQYEVDPQIYFKIDYRRLFYLKM